MPVWRVSVVNKKMKRGFSEGDLFHQQTRRLCSQARQSLTCLQWSGQRGKPDELRYEISYHYTTLLTFRNWNVRNTMVIFPSDRMWAVSTARQLPTSVLHQLMDTREEGSLHTCLLCSLLHVFWAMPTLAHQLSMVEPVSDVQKSLIYINLCNWCYRGI